MHHEYAHNAVCCVSWKVKFSFRGKSGELGPSFWIFWIHPCWNVEHLCLTFYSVHLQECGNFWPQPCLSWLLYFITWTEQRSPYYLITGLPNSMPGAEQQNKKKRAKKQPFTIKFDSEVDFGKCFSRGRVMPLAALHIISCKCQHCTPLTSHHSD